jgi:hypothetical protein
MERRRIIIDGRAIRLEPDWAFLRWPEKGDFCPWCPVVTKTHNDGSISRMQNLGMPAEDCKWHGFAPCKGGCGVMTWDAGLGHYQSGTNPWTGEGEFTSYYRCDPKRKAA